MKLSGKFFFTLCNVNNYFILHKHVVDQRARAILISALVFPSEVVSVGGDYKPPGGVEKE